MLKILISLMLVTALAGAGLGTVGLVGAGADRADCPGKIVCPITGDLVCKDRCPATRDANRPDCPGKIECPLTGELVGKDRCPLGEEAKSEGDSQSPPPCCAMRK